MESHATSAPTAKQQLKKGEDTMPRVHIYFTQETLEELKQFVLDKYGEKKAMSITVEQAVKDYLEHQKLKEQLARLEAR